MQVHNVTADAETFTCNAYLVVGDRNVLIDAGSAAGVVDAVRDRVAALDAVALTHQHGDHVGQLDAVLDAFDADLFCYDDHPRRTRELADGDALQIGDEEYEAVYSPGHADDHLAFVSETTIFSGDVVVYSDGAFDDGSFGRTDMAGQSRDREIESIRTILDRLPASVEHMYAGHGDAFHEDGRESSDSRSRRTKSDGVREVVERALERAERREPKYPDE
jgi:glyoxylase-like metal-dependent hydrolase (beta-lactamase superfamily II)